MNTPKTAASLTASLLARKGMAQPAMRRQTVTGLGTANGTGTGPRAVSPFDDLGWNDMGEDVTPTPAPSPVALHIAAIQETLDRRRADRRAEPTAEQATAGQATAGQATAEAAPPAPSLAPTTPVAPRARPKAQPAARVQTVKKTKSAFTLRIDADRHLRLRLISAVTNRSAQQLLTGALDALIAQHPEIDALAASTGNRRSGSDTGME